MREWLAYMPPPPKEIFNDMQAYLTDFGFVFCLAFLHEISLN